LQLGKKISIASIIILLLIIIILQYSKQTPKIIDKEKRGLIIDALALDRPNPKFLESITRILNYSDYDFDLIYGEKVTVDSLKEISNDYSLIVFRVHSEAFNNQVFLFTSESYRRLKYLSEQMLFEVTGARPGGKGDMVFAIGLNFMKKYWKGRLNGSMIIMMGCRGFYKGSSVQGQEGLGSVFRTIDWFLEEGVKAYIGWDDLVDLEHTDKAIIRLLEALHYEKMDLSSAINKVSDEIGSDPYGSTLCYITP
jgi:hypothetical protein